MRNLSISLAPDVAMEFVRIPAGGFLMGSRGYNALEEPVHRVQISLGFYLGVTPVTQAQFAVWTEEQAIEHENEFSGKPQNPAESVDWNQALAYCEWLTRCNSREYKAGSPSTYRATGIPLGYFAGLPSEAQWEHACRGGAEQNTEYHSGDGEAALAEVGWYQANAKGQTQPIGKKAFNGFGLYDMHGSVEEWCQDAWDADNYKFGVDGVCDPVAVADEKSGIYPIRVIRGGSWFNSAGDCRSAYRNRSVIPVGNQGFRVGLFAGTKMVITI